MREEPVPTPWCSIPPSDGFLHDNVLEERKKGYEEQLKHEQEEVQQVRRRLENEKGQLVDWHEREAEIWAKMREQYEEASALYKQEILDLKNAQQHAQNHAGVVKENIRIILQTNREKFSVQLKTAMDKGWEAWATQTAELHTYRADWENCKKVGASTNSARRPWP